MTFLVNCNSFTGLRPPPLSNPSAHSLYALPGQVSKGHRCRCPWHTQPSSASARTGIHFEWLLRKSSCALLLSMTFGHDARNCHQEHYRFHELGLHWATAQSEIVIATTETSVLSSKSQTALFSPILSISLPHTCLEISVSINSPLPSCKYS